MDDQSKMLWASGCLLGATGVALGVFGTHALKKMIVDLGKIRSWEIATHYQLFHAVPVLLAASRESLHLGGWLLVSGTALFSGSIYALVLSPRWRILGPVTPIGGLLLLGGWVHLALNYSR